MVPYSCDEWAVILAAYAYEVESKPIMSDSTFDTLCRTIQTRNIPGFSPSTGMWVHDALEGVDIEFVRGALAKLRRIGAGASVSHIRFPPGYLIPVHWARPTTFDGLKP